MARHLVIQQLLPLLLAFSLCHLFGSSALPDLEPALNEGSVQETEPLGEEESRLEARRQDFYQTQDLLWQFLRYGLGEKVEAGAKGLVNFPLARQRVFLNVLRQLYTSHFVAHPGLGASEKRGTVGQVDESVNTATGSNTTEELLLLELDSLAGVQLVPNVSHRARIMLLSATQLLQAQLGGNASFAKSATRQLATNGSIVDRMVALEQFLESIATFQMLNLPVDVDRAEDSDSSRSERHSEVRKARQHPQVLIVGGGPSGLVSAIHAALEQPHSSVTVLEKRRRYTRNIWFDLYGQVRLPPTLLRILQVQATQVKVR